MSTATSGPRLKSSTLTGLLGAVVLNDIEIEVGPSHGGSLKLSGRRAYLTQHALRGEGETLAKGADRSRLGRVDWR